MGEPWMEPMLEMENALEGRRPPTISPTEKTLEPRRLLSADTQATLPVACVSSLSISVSHVSVLFLGARSCSLSLVMPLEEICAFELLIATHDLASKPCLGAVVHLMPSRIFLSVNGLAMSSKRKGADLRCSARVKICLGSQH